MNQEHSLSTVAAVVVTYYPNFERLRTLLTNIEAQVGQIFIIDNGSGNSREIQAISASVKHTQVILCHKNLGLGHAHNLGIRESRIGGMSAVLLLDQDSIPESHMVEELLSELNKLNQTNREIAAVGARYVGTSTGHPSFFVQFRLFRFRKVFCYETKNMRAIPTDMLISSGTLIPISAIDTIGEMDETLFIDHTDTDWFLRAKSRGWDSYGICSACMEHRLGEENLRVWWGRWRYLPIHRPFRYYYIYRNSVLLYQRKYSDLHWKQADLVRLIMMALIFVMLSARRFEILRMISRGIVDGLRGRTGPMELHHH